MGSQRRERGEENFVADGKVTFANVQLPYGVVNGDVKDYASTCRRPRPPQATRPRRTPLSRSRQARPRPFLTPSINQKGVVITLTKYDKPYGVEEGRSTLAGAQFTLYRMNADGTQDADFAPLSQTTLEDGAIRFDIPPAAHELASYYAIRETKTPDGLEEGSLELTTSPIPQSPRRSPPVRTATSAWPRTRDVALNAYNTPLGKIAILKYDYLDPTALPKDATFEAVGPVTLQAHGDGTPAGWELAGYDAKGDHYEKDGISYTFYYIEDVPQGTYTVTETEKPTGYLYTPNAEGEFGARSRVSRSATMAASPWWCLPTCPTRRSSMSISRRRRNTSAKATCWAMHISPSVHPQPLHLRHRAAAGKRDPHG